MKPGLPWQVSGVGREARQTAREAARRAGMSLGEWLDSVILESAESDADEARRLSEPESRLFDQDPDREDAWSPRSRDGEHEDRAGLPAPARREPSFDPERFDSDDPMHQDAGLPARARNEDRSANHVSFAELNRRLDELTGQLGKVAATAAQLALPGPRASDTSHQLVAVISKVDRRLDELIAEERSSRSGMEQRVDAVGRAIADLNRERAHPVAAHEPPSPLDQALIEIADRQRALDDQAAAGAGPVSTRTTSAAEGLPRAHTQELSGLEQQLREINAHVETLKPCGVDKAIDVLRDDLAQIGLMLQEALPRKSIEPIEQVGALAEAMPARNQGGQSVPYELESVIKGLVDKIERVQLTRADQAVLGHLEDRIASLVEKLDASDAKLNHLEAIKRGLAELLIHLEQRAANPARAQSWTPEMNELSRDVAHLRQTGRKTQESLEVVHGTLGHLVDRLAMIETDMHSGLAGRTPLLKAGATNRQALSSLPAQAPQPGDFVATETTEPFALEEPPDAERRTIDPSLPPDHPLEPGLSGSRRVPPGSPADRIAASESLIFGTMPPAPEPGGKSNFIAAARRAAQAASRESPAKRAVSGLGEATPASGKLAAIVNSKARALIAAGSAIAIVIGGFQIARTFLSSPQETHAPAPDSLPLSGSVAPERPAEALKPAPTGTKEAIPTPEAPALPPSSKPAGARQSGLSVPGGASPLPAIAAIPIGIAREATSAPQWPGTDDRPGEHEITGTISPGASPATPTPVARAHPAPLPAAAPAQPIPGQAPAPAASTPDRLPPNLSASLRAAAGRGEAPAQYEVAQRFAEGQGVPQNFTEAAQWFERAARQGLVLAQFRLGGLYEKGLGVRKDLEAARRYYVLAGEAGNGKALHNLAVLHAEGIDGKPDYATAAKWFRKAADYGIADSQYNLAILYARGIGVEQNLTEAYKWFALAAKEGDVESARKRDELGARLDRASFAQATQMVQDFAPQPQPEAAISVKAPPGGWEQAVSSVSVPSRQKPPMAITPKLDLATPRRDQ
jgi:localization factor PodJL